MKKTIYFLGKHNNQTNVNIFTWVKAEKVNQNDTKYVTAFLCLF